LPVPEISSPNKLAAENAIRDAADTALFVELAVARPSRSRTASRSTVGGQVTVGNFQRRNFQRSS
jgi:hypothetical protein